MASLLNLFQSSENPFFVSAFTLANNKAYVAVAVTVAVAAGVVVTVTVATAVNCMQSKHARTKATEKGSRKTVALVENNAEAKHSDNALGFCFSLCFFLPLGNTSVFWPQILFYVLSFMIPECTCSLFIPAGF